MTKLKKLYYIVDKGEYGQGRAVSLGFSKKGCVMAEYTNEPEYFDTYKEVCEFLRKVKKSVFDYSFGTGYEIKNQYIKRRNLRIERDVFELDEE